MKINGKEYFPTNHGFLLHSEYIHHEDELQDFDEDVEIEDDDDDNDYDEYDPWKELLKQENEEERTEKNEKFIDKLGCMQYPIFMSFDAFKTQIEILYPEIIWTLSKTEIFENIKCDIWFAEVYTKNGHLIFMVIAEEEDIYSPIRIDVKFTDYPYIEVRKIAKFLHTYLFHFNSLNYLDVEDDGEVETDLFQSYH